MKATFIHVSLILRFLGNHHIFEGYREKSNCSLPVHPPSAIISQFSYPPRLTLMLETMSCSHQYLTRYYLNRRCIGRPCKICSNQLNETWITFLEVISIPHLLTVWTQYCFHKDQLLRNRRSAQARLFLAQKQMLKKRQILWFSSLSVCLDKRNCMLKIHY